MSNRPLPKWLKDRFITDATDRAWGMPVGKVALRTHKPEQCAGEFCVIHNPSDHPMRSWPTNWRGDTGIMERICEHGVGHPDPDDFAFHLKNGRGYLGTHGCDGCGHD